MEVLEKLTIAVTEDEVEALGPENSSSIHLFVETGPERVRIVFKKSEFILKELIEQRIRCFYADIIVGQQDYLHSSALQSQ